MRTVRWILVPMWLAACTAEVPEEVGVAPDSDDGITEVEGALTDLSAQCAFNATSGVVTLTLLSGDVALVNKASSGAILVNGYACGAATATSTKRIDVTGSTGTDTLVLDYMGGTFAMGTATSAGVVVDLVSGSNDAVKIRGSKAADTYVAGTTGIAINADANKDVTVANIDALTVSLSDGNDSFSGAGNAATGGASYTGAITVYGGAGNDSLLGGSAGDTVWGGDGNDTMLGGTVADGGDSIHGGNGTDTMDYSARTVNGVGIYLYANLAEDGEAGETDTVFDDIETLRGTKFSDVLAAAAGAQTIYAGAGNDQLVGYDGDDVLYGEDGNDTFSMGAADDGADVLVGGAGTDTAEYVDRVNPVFVTLDGVADDGELGEGDKASADIENIIGGGDNDTLTGNASANKIEGRLGDDTISGGDGNDTLVGGDGDDDLAGGNGLDVFDEEAFANGADTIVGGAGTDTVTYAARIFAVTVVMDGATSSGDTGEGDLIGLDVENLIGSTDADTITGNASDNVLEGGPGTAIDTIHGLGGEDVLDGGGGVDVLDCGAGDADVSLDADATLTSCEL